MATAWSIANTKYLTNCFHIYYFLSPDSRIQNYETRITNLSSLEREPATKLTLPVGTSRGHALQMNMLRHDYSAIKSSMMVHADLATGLPGPKIAATPAL